MNQPVGPTLVSNKFNSTASAGTVVGGNLLIPAASFTDDNGNSITTFPSSSYFNLFINGLLQPNGVTGLSPSQVEVIGGGALDPADPITLELVQLQLSPLSNSMVFTTGVIQNSGSNPGVMYSMLISNEDLSSTAIVEFEFFEATSDPTGVPKIPIAHQKFSLAPLDTLSRALSIVGLQAWEAQFSVTGDNVVINSNASDARGNTLATILQAESSGIAHLTPVP